MQNATYSVYVDINYFWWCKLTILDIVLIVDIKAESASAEVQERIESNKQELDRYLGVYPHDKFVD